MRKLQSTRIPSLAFFGYLAFVTGASDVRAQEAASPNDQAETTGPAKTVTIEKYNSVVKYIKKLNERIKKLEETGAQAKDGAPAGTSGEETVDLSQMDSTSGKKAPEKDSGAPAGVHSRRMLATPNFHVFFDLNLIHRPGVTDLTFDAFHTFLLFELAPTPEFQFSFDVNPTPRYFELDYQINKRLTFRAGKIWIPFDDMAPHNIFGGRVNVSRLTLGAAYLPDLWTDLGVGLKWQIVDSANLNLLSHFYIVNGFRSGGIDPLDPAAEYPTFADLATSPDNNSGKSIGGRLQATLFRKLGLGASVYTGQWSDQDDAAKNVLIWGTDAQLRFTSTELRFGLSGMTAGLANDTFNRGGFYGEVGQKFGSNRQFKALLRGGALQLDDRVIDTNDRTLVGGTLLYQPGPIQISIEHSRDINTAVTKVDKEYTALRLVVAL